MASAPTQADLYNAGILNLAEEDQEGRVWIRLFGLRYRVVRVPAIAGSGARSHNGSGGAGTPSTDPLNYFGKGPVEEAEIVMRELQSRTGRRAEIKVHVKPPMVYLDVLLGDECGAGAGAGAGTGTGRRAVAVAVEISSARLPFGSGAPAPPPDSAQAKGRESACPHPQQQQQQQQQQQPAPATASVPAPLPATAGNETPVPAFAPTSATTAPSTSLPTTPSAAAAPHGAQWPDSETEALLLARIAQSMMVYDWELKKRRKGLGKRLNG